MSFILLALDALETQNNPNNALVWIAKYLVHSYCVTFEFEIYASLLEAKQVAFQILKFSLKAIFFSPKIGKLRRS